jgi:hypothetical protein
MIYQIKLQDDLPTKLSYKGTAKENIEEQVAFSFCITLTQKTCWRRPCPLSEEALFRVK